MLRLASMGRNPYAVPAGLFVAIFLTYGVFIPWHGFYWDDWPTAWFNYLQGPAVYWQVFASDRPILPWLYSLTTPWLGVSPLAWQSFVVFARWVAGVCAWWTVRKVWPGWPIGAALTALFFSLYPGFKQAPVAIIYSHFFLLFGMSFASLGVMVVSVRAQSRRRLLQVIALLLGALSIFSIEYTAGLELIRPLLLWLAIGSAHGRGWSRLRAVLRSWAPYALLFGAYLGWRVLVLGFPTYQPELLTGMDSDLVQALGRMVSKMAGALYTATFGAWGQTLDFPALVDIGRRGLLGYAAIVAAAAGVAFLILRANGDATAGSVEGTPSRAWPWQAIGIGMAAMIAGGLPVWITQLPVGLEYPWDRLTLPLALGACLAAAGFLGLFRGHAPRLVIAVAMLGLSAGTHSLSNRSYVMDAEDLGGFLWQLSWRIPGLEKGTALLTNDIPLRYYSDNSLTAALNWMYAPENRSLRMDYMLYYPTVRAGLALSVPDRGLPIHQVYRAASFDGSTSQMLALYYSPPGCVHVLDVVLDDSMPNLPASLSAWVPLSRLDLIQAGSGGGPVPPLYPQEPEHNWCYYFERADLARQLGNWRAVAELGDLAFSVDHPNDPSERLVFIEGYAHMGRLDRAEDLSYEALEQNPAVNRMVCHTWERIERHAELGEDGRSAAIRVRKQAACDDA